MKTVFPNRERVSHLGKCFLIGNVSRAGESTYFPCTVPFNNSNNSQRLLGAVMGCQAETI